MITTWKHFFSRMLPSLSYPHAQSSCAVIPEVPFEFLARLRRHLQSGPRRAVYTPISRAEKMCSDEGKTYRCLTSNLSRCPSLLFSSLAWSRFSLFVTFPVMRTRADLLSFQSLSAQYVAQRAACGRLGMTFGSGLLISSGNKTRDNMPSSASGDRNGRRDWNSIRCGLEVLVVRPQFLHPEDEPGRRIKACPKAKKKDTKQKKTQTRLGTGIVGRGARCGSARRAGRAEATAGTPRVGFTLKINMAQLHNHRSLHQGRWMFKSPDNLRRRGGRDIACIT